jgi:hypothetical protein
MGHRGLPKTITHYSTVKQEFPAAIYLITNVNPITKQPVPNAHSRRRIPSLRPPSAAPLQCCVFLSNQRRNTLRTAGRFAPHRSYLALYMWRIMDTVPAQ